MEADWIKFEPRLCSDFADIRSFLFSDRTNTYNSINYWKCSSNLGEVSGPHLWNYILLKVFSHIWNYWKLWLPKSSRMDIPRSCDYHRRGRHRSKLHLEWHSMATDWFIFKPIQHSCSDWWSGFCYALWQRTGTTIISPNSLQFGFAINPAKS